MVVSHSAACLQWAAGPLRLPVLWPGLAPAQAPLPGQRNPRAALRRLCHGLALGTQMSGAPLARVPRSRPQMKCGFVQTSRKPCP